MNETDPKEWFSFPTLCVQFSDIVSFLGENSVCPHKERERRRLNRMRSLSGSGRRTTATVACGGRGASSYDVCNFLSFFSHPLIRNQLILLILLPFVNSPNSVEVMCYWPLRGKSHNSYDFLWAGRTDRVKWRQAATTHLEL